MFKTHVWGSEEKLVSVAQLHSCSGALLHSSQPSDALLQCTVAQRDSPPLPYPAQGQANLSGWPAQGKFYRVQTADNVWFDRVSYELSWSANSTTYNNNTKDMVGQFSCMIRSGSTLWCWPKENYAVCRHGQCYGLMGLMVWCHPIGNPCYQHKENFFISGRISWNNMERHGMVWYGISGDQFTQL